MGDWHPVAIQDGLTSLSGSCKMTDQPSHIVDRLQLQRFQLQAATGPNWFNNNWEQINEPLPSNAAHGCFAMQKFALLSGPQRGHYLTLHWYQHACINMYGAQTGSETAGFKKNIIHAINPLPFSWRKYTDVSGWEDCTNKKQ